MPTEIQCEAQYHCGIGELLSAAYQREFTMEKGKWKTEFPTFREWYATLNHEQRLRVDQLLAKNFGNGEHEKTGTVEGCVGYNRR